jgi:ribosomal protein S14
MTLETFALISAIGAAGSYLVWVWRRGAGRDEPDEPLGVSIPAPVQAKPRRKVKYDHVPCPDCGRLRALTRQGEFHLRTHVCRMPKVIAEASPDEVAALEPEDAS